MRIHFTTAIKIYLLDQRARERIFTDFGDEAVGIAVIHIGFPQISLPARPSSIPVTTGTRAE